MRQPSIPSTDYTVEPHAHCSSKDLQNNTPSVPRVRARKILARQHSEGHRWQESHKLGHSSLASVWLRCWRAAVA